MSAALVRSVWGPSIPRALQRGVLGALAAWANPDGTFNHPPTVAALVANVYPGGRRLRTRAVQYHLRILERFGVLVVETPAAGRGHARVYRLVAAAIPALTAAAVAAAGFPTGTIAIAGKGANPEAGKGAKKGAKTPARRVQFPPAKGANPGRAPLDPVQTENVQREITPGDTLLATYANAWARRYHTPADVTARDRQKADTLTTVHAVDRLRVAVAAYVESDGFYAERGHPFALFAANAGTFVARTAAPPEDDRTPWATGEDPWAHVVRWWQTQIRTDRAMMTRITFVAEEGDVVRVSGDVDAKCWLLGSRFRMLLLQRALADVRPGARVEWVYADSFVEATS